MLLLWCVFSLSLSLSLSQINEMHTNGGANFTSFGIGASFDEKLMMGIAEHGRGDYLFIEGAQDIEKKVMQVNS